jgi:hypothetical protein
MARKNIAASGMQDRIDLLVQSVEELEESETFSLAWLPGPFLSAETVTAALERVRSALIPGGWLVFSCFSVGSERLSEPLTALKVLRNGGYPWRKDELESKLSDAGFEQVGSYSTIGSAVALGCRRQFERLGSCQVSNGSQLRDPRLTYTRAFRQSGQTKAAEQRFI